MAQEQRRLAAIAAADVVGYSRLMGRDESGTIVRLREHRTQRLGPALARHGGRAIKLAGDGALIEFASAVEALSATIEFQQAMADANRDQPDDTAIVFRIGLHLGDVVVDDDDLYGDGVNVAARLEPQAPGGGIVVSRAMHEAVAGRVKATFEDLGDLQLKNIERPVQAFAVGWSPADWEVSPSSTAAPAPTSARATTGLAASIGSKRLPLWAVAMAGVVILAGAGYLAFSPKSPPTLAELQSLKAEDLERLLTERRAADVAAAEKKRLEEEAQRTADADAAAKRQADADLEKARSDRQKAEAELSTLKADMEARRQAESAGQQQVAEAVARRAAEEEAQRKAEAEMVTLRQVEQDAQRKAAAEAENKRQADEALAKAQAARQKADEEAASRRQAEERAEADAKLKVDAEAAVATAQKQKAEAAAAENGLRLGVPDRQRIQISLTSLGFDTRGTDGALGPRSREMIAGWQQKAGAPATGFVTAAQRDQLFRSAAPAIARWEEEQKKVDDERKKASDVRAAAIAPPAAPAPAMPAPVPPAQGAPSPAAAAPSANAYDGAYSGTIPLGTFNTQSAAGVRTIKVLVTNGKGSGTIYLPGCGSTSISVTISSTGDISGKGEGYRESSCPGQPVYYGPLTIKGRAAGERLQLDISGDISRTRVSLVRSGN